MKYENMHLANAPKSSQSLLFHYLVALFAFGTVLLASVSLVKVQILEGRLAHLEQQLDELKRTKIQFVDPRTEILRDYMYPDYGSDYLDDDDSTKSEENTVEDTPYGFSIGDVLVEDSEKPGSRFKRDIQENRRRRRHRPDEITTVKPHHRRPSIVATHFSGSVRANHPHEKAAGHIRHANRTYVYWKESDWSTKYKKYFDMEYGMIKVQESGLYFIYAQINFLTPQDNAGFKVMRNDHLILSCMVASLSHPNSSRTDKSNTCFTAGAEHLKAGDRIYVEDYSDSSYSRLEAGKSFFGAIRLSS